MKGFLYKMEGCDSALELSHGWKYTFYEIFVPEIGLCFNSKNFVFRTEVTRYKDVEPISEIELTLTETAILSSYIDVKRIVEGNLVPKYFAKVEKNESKSDT